MRQSFIFFFIMIFLLGCGTSQRAHSPDTVKSANLPLNKRFADSFRPKLGEYDVLARESAARFSDARLEELEDSGNPLSHVVAACIQEDFNKGFDILDQNYLLFKKHPGFWNQMGNCYFLKGEFGKAILYYNKSREINPRYSPPVNNLGVVYQKRGEDQKALIAFKKAIRLAANALTPNYNLAQLYLKYGMIKRAKSIYSKLYRKNDTDNDVINGLANCYLIQGQIDKALSYFERIDYEAVKHPTASLNYAVALKIKGAFKQAKNVFDKMDGPDTSELREYKEKVESFIEGSR